MNSSPEFYITGKPEDLTPEHAEMKRPKDAEEVHSYLKHISPIYRT